MNDDCTPLHPSARSVVADIRSRFPDTPFLALGQTALWDEPTKASFRRVLDGLWPDARLIAASHDTDYFAKLPGHPAAAGGEKYALVSHDDARTRGLWSAAGEMSTLFGSEDVPTQTALMREAGVNLAHALRYVPDDIALLSELTSAWGWTGIIHTEWERVIARDIPLQDILPTLIDQVRWASQESIARLNGEKRRLRAQTVATRIENWILDFATTHEGASLTELYRDLFPRFYEMLLGAPPANLSTSSTSRLLRFNQETASLPRFAFVDLFLSPITRRQAIDAYNLAVAGSDTYTLDKFGNGALPFDLVVPERGRGTLRILPDGNVLIDTPQPINLCDGSCDLTSVRGLAKLVERELGPDVVLVGKAVSLLPMLAAEFTLIFHEGASSYASRTVQMVERIRRARLPLPPLRPIVRVRYSTWDSLGAVPAQSNTDTLRLPEFLAQSFGFENISFEDFGACWRRAVELAQKELDQLNDLRSPRELLAYLARTRSQAWPEQVREYEAARLKLLSLNSKAQVLQGQIITNYDGIRRARREADQLEREKGDDFRKRVQPLRERLFAARSKDEEIEIQSLIDAAQTERADRYDIQIRMLRGEVRYGLEQVRRLKTERLELERGAATEARQAMRSIESAAEREKAKMARNALQSLHGLPHTDFRPSSWWFPLVDDTGAWFTRLTETAELYLEELG